MTTSTKYLYYFSMNTQKVEEFKVETLETPGYVNIKEIPRLSTFYDVLSSRFKRDSLNTLYESNYGYYMLSETENLRKFKTKLSEIFYLEENKHLNQAKYYNQLIKKLNSTAKVDSTDYEDSRIEEFIETR